MYRSAAGDVSLNAQQDVSFLCLRTLLDRRCEERSNTHKIASFISLFTEFNAK
jgi:hypothetical protein